jgi:adenylate cyclase
VEQRRLAAILAADVVGYSRLVGRDESGTLAAFKACRRELFEVLVPQFGGRIVKSTGDGFLIEFQSVVNAVRCAVALQTGLAARAAAEPPDRQIVFRMGVHAGDIVVDDGDIFGDGVNVAARLEPLAEPGGICLSDRAFRDLHGRVDVPFVDGGEQALKNIERPVRVWRWCAVEAAEPSAALSSSVVAPVERPSIAVLPFLNMSGDQEQEYFADGVTEDVITALSRFRSLLVIARNSTFSFTGRHVDARVVGKELGARYMVEGSIRRAGDRVRTTAKLVECDSGSQIWADRYEGTLDDIFALQDELTGRIVASLLPEMTKAEIGRAQRVKATQLSAWDLYLRALPKIRSNVRAEVAEAETLLRSALAADPAFAAALSRLSSCHLKAAYLGWDDETRATDEAATHAAAAITADPDDGLGYDAFASVQQKRGEMAEAVASARRAIELSPSLTAAYGTLISALAFCGDSEEAREVFAFTERLSPRDPDRSSRVMGLVVAAFAAGDNALAETLARQHALLQPNWYGNLTFLAAALAHLGKLDEAKATSARLLKLIPGYNLGWPERRRMLQRDGDHRRFIEGLRMSGVPAE